jgi:uncharacterized protein (DUF885 family)
MSYYTATFLVADYVTSTPRPKAPIVSEVERYVVSPRQACSYKIGQLRILQLRAKARRALGENFSLQGFHDLVLATGSIPLGVLEQVVDGYVQPQK